MVPRWVKVFATILAVVVLLLLAVSVVGGGEHGPGRHSDPGAARGGRWS